MRFWLALVLLIILGAGAATVGILQFDSILLLYGLGPQSKSARFTIEPEILILAKFTAGMFAAELLLLLMSALAATRHVGRHKKVALAQRETELFSRATLDAIEAQIAIVEESGIVCAVNKAWAGFQADESEQIIQRVGLGQNFLAICDSATGRRSNEAAAIARAIRRVQMGQSDGELLESAGHSGQADAWYLCRVSRFPGEGRPRAVVLFEDITQRKAAEAQVQRARELSDAANASKSAFLANMSHEIRTPMTAILGYAELMQDGDQSPQKREHCLQIIRRNGEHLLALINDILDLSKIEADKLALEKVPTDLPQLIGDVALLMRHRAEQKQLSFRVTFDGTIPRTIQTDPVRLRQVLLNLLSNAIKFTQDGGVTLRVACQETVDDSIVHFDVIDTGVGMDADALARLFKPFMQADQSTTRRFGGTGLGLSISRKLAALFGGDIVVQSTPAVGSIFSVWIDGGSLRGVARLQGLTEQHLLVAGPAPRARFQLSGRVLLAEDGEDNRELLGAILGDAGLQVTFAENGRIAFDRAMRESFDVILMDMQMPELDGYSATRKLRARGLKTPIIALTAHAMTDDRKRCLDAGCDEYCSKPVDRNLLIATIGKLMGAAPLSAADAAPQRAEKIRSSRADDPKLAGILGRFVERLPQRVREIASLLGEANLTELQRTVHQIKGAAGGYGFPEITDQAARAEGLMRSEATLEKITEQTRRLIELIENVEGYAAAPTVLDPVKPSGGLIKHSGSIRRGHPQEGSRVDLATNLPNRRYMEDRMAAELSISRRTRQTLSCALLRLDLLAQVRPQQGEKAANDLLGLAARAIGFVCGELTIGRWDEDKFMLLLLGRDRAAADQFVRDLQQHVEGFDPQLKLTVTCLETDFRAVDSSHIAEELERTLPRPTPTDEPAAAR